MAEHGQATVAGVVRLSVWCSAARRLPTPKKAELLRQAGLYVCTRKEHSECMREDVAEDPGSEVDFGSSSDHDAATPAASPVLVQPNLHRRRLATKTQPPRFAPRRHVGIVAKAAGHQLPWPAARHHF